MYAGLISWRQLQNNVRDEMTLSVQEEKMNTKRSMYVLVFAVLFVAATFFMQSVYANAGIPARGREDRANQADIQRWAAAGDYYSKKPGSIDDAAVKLSRDFCVNMFPRDARLLILMLDGSQTAVLFEPDEFILGYINK
jgi:hypothetical protein